MTKNMKWVLAVLLTVAAVLGFTLIVTNHITNSAAAALGLLFPLLCFADLCVLCKLS